ncbi:unnamed protein product [Ectocarpus sp. CCAP 1310/34]|nr:unnamed protein product [Ectocarpus sp. CCAP 1310/34]
MHTTDENKHSEDKQYSNAFRRQTCWRVRGRLERQSERLLMLGHFHLVVIGVGNGRNEGPSGVVTLCSATSGGVCVIVCHF